MNEYWRKKFQKENAEQKAEQERLQKLVDEIISEVEIGEIRAKVAEIYKKASEAITDVALIGAEETARRSPLFPDLKPEAQQLRIKAARWGKIEEAVKLHEEAQELITVARAKLELGLEKRPPEKLTSEERTARELAELNRRNRILDRIEELQHDSTFLSLGTIKQAYDQVNESDDREAFEAFCRAGLRALGKMGEGREVQKHQRLLTRGLRAARETPEQVEDREKAAEIERRLHQVNNGAEFLPFAVRLENIGGPKLHQINNLPGGNEPRPGGDS